VCLGVLLFDETIRLGWWLVPQVAGLLAIAVGYVELSGSSLAAALAQSEQRAAESTLRTPPTSCERRATMTSREELELAREWVEHDRFIAERARFGTGDRPELPLSNRDAPRPANGYRGQPERIHTGRSSRGERDRDRHTIRAHRYAAEDSVLDRSGRHLRH